MTNEELLDYCRELEMRINAIAADVTEKSFRYELDTKADKSELDALRGATEAAISITDTRILALEATIATTKPDSRKGKKELLATLIEIFERMYEEL